MSEITSNRNKWALLVGINAYPKLEQRYQLHGCVNDVELMASTLHRTFHFPESGVTLLRNEQATRDAILDAFDALVGRTHQDDIVVVHYSGHGSQVRDREGDEPDGWDETIVPFDAGRSPHPFRDITDDEIYVRLLQLSAITPYITLIFDSCHSGTVARDAFGDASRWLEPDERPIEQLPPSPIPAEIVTNVREGERDRGSSSWLPLGKRYILIASCRDEESSYEHSAGASWYGTLTYFLNQELVNAEPGVTYRDVFERTSIRVTADKINQHPQLEGARDRELFGVRDIEPMRFVPLRQRTEKTVSLAAGEAHGLTVGSRWAVYPQATKEVTEATPMLGLVEITTTRAVTSDAAIQHEDQAAGRPGIRPGDRAVEVAHAYGDMRLKVNLEAPLAFEQAGSELKELIEASPLLRLATVDEADVRAYLIPARADAGSGDPVPQLGARRAATWAVVGRDGRLIMPAHLVNESGVSTLLRENLEKRARYDNALTLRNPNETSALKDKLEFTLLRRAGNAWEVAEPDQAAGQIIYGEGDRIAVRITNRHTTPIHVSILDFGLIGAISLLHPIEGASERLEAGRSIEIGTREGEEIDLYVPDNFPYMPDPTITTSPGGRETFKLLATTHEADFRPLLQEGMRGPVTKASESPLCDLLTMALAGHGTRDARQKVPPPQEDWTTVERFFFLKRRLS